MTIPYWATAVVGNYKTMFKEKHGRDFRGSDELVFNLWNDLAGAMPTAKELDEAVLEDMLDQEDK